MGSIVIIKNINCTKQLMTPNFYDISPIHAKFKWLKRTRAQLKWTDKINYKLQLGHDGTIKISNTQMAHVNMCHVIVPKEV